MKKFIYTVFAVILSVSITYSQEEQEKPKVKDKPVREPFSNGLLIDNQTCQMAPKKTLEVIMQHRFGTMENGIKDIYGIYALANIRIGFNYSILDNLEVGYGLTRKSMYSDFHVKWNVLQQTRKNTIPIFVTLYGNMAIDGRNESVFASAGEDSTFSFTNRLAYFSQLIVGRKFNDWLSLQLHTSFTHYNKVAEDKDHDVVGLGFNGRIKFSPQSSFIFQYDIPLKIKSMSEQTNFDKFALPNFAFGYEVATSTHAFQVYVTTANGIVPQDIYMYNYNDWTHGVTDLMFGFTITRLWGF